MAKAKKPQVKIIAHPWDGEEELTEAEAEVEGAPVAMTYDKNKRVAIAGAKAAALAMGYAIEEE